jgi:hypothetical protein
VSVRTGVVLGLTIALALGGCTRAGAELGAGSRDLNVCGAWALFDSFDEPDPADREDLLRWTRGGIRVLDRIDYRQEVDDEPVPSAVRRRLRQVESALVEFRDAVEDAGDADELEQAVADFSVGSFNDSSRGVTEFEAARCSR